MLLPGRTRESDDGQVVSPDGSGQAFDIPPHPSMYQPAQQTRCKLGPALNWPNA